MTRRTLYYSPNDCRSGRFNTAMLTLEIIWTDLGPGFEWVRPTEDGGVAITYDRLLSDSERRSLDNIVCKHLAKPITPLQEFTEEVWRTSRSRVNKGETD